MKEPIKNRRPFKQPVDNGPRTAMPGWTDHSDSFKSGEIVQAKRRGPNAYLDIRLPAGKPKGSVTFYVQGSVEEAIAWLIKNKDRLKYAAQAG